LYIFSEDNGGEVTGVFLFQKKKYRMAETEGKERFLKKAERKACWDAKETFYFILSFIHS
jgi:hypothetical protein